MNILVTGAYGNIGTQAVRELLLRGHHVACFDLRTPGNEKKAAQLGSQIQCFWGDLLDPATLEPAVAGVDVIIHLAAIIPPLSEKNPDLAKKVNVGGTRALVGVMAGMHPAPRLLFTSSISVFGDTLDLPPPRTVDDPLRPTDTYSHTKVECEEIIRDSGLEAIVFRLSATPPINTSKMDPMMFEIRLDARMEYLHPADVARAIANGIVCDEAWGRTFLIGGGNECQLYYRDFIGGILSAIGIGPLPEAAFGKAPFYTDWLDTTESQAMLNYQQITYKKWQQELVKTLGLKVKFAKLFRPLVRWSILNTSPYWKAAKQAGSQG
ncbi:MAG TPA: NAD(P)-dependent oxidoreductase [Candidatus Lokiarchaeia archaeon]|nr:NAD(P)-dependent oxidoreductase [Candidatus Lokiarchaeia archaeon]